MTDTHPETPPPSSPASNPPRRSILDKLPEQSPHAHWTALIHNLGSAALAVYAAHLGLIPGDTLVYLLGSAIGGHVLLGVLGKDRSVPKQLVILLAAGATYGLHKAPLLAAIATKFVKMG